MAFLRYATAAPPEVFSFEAAARKLAPVEGLPAGTPNQAWLALDLLGMLMRLHEGGQATSVLAILELPAARCPELLVLGFASARRCLISTPGTLPRIDIIYLLVCLHCLLAIS